MTIPSLTNHARPTRPRWRRSLPLLALTLLSAGCASLPKDGPLGSDLVSEARDEKAAPFALVPVSAGTLTTLSSLRPAGFATVFGDGPAVEPRLAIGDGVSLTVYEAGSETLFGTPSASGGGGAGTRGATLPERVIALDGRIDVPYAGPIAAAGLTVSELQAAVEKALAGRATRPQVIVTTTRRVGSAVTVLGEAGAGARVPLTARGERLLDILTESGGLRGAVFETWVELNRGGKAVRLPLVRVLREPRENIRMRAGDTLLITRQPETFTVFGATGRSAQIEFGAERVSLAEAVAKAGGLQDSRADPRSVFLFRYEPKAVADRLGAGGVVQAGLAPVVYQIDFLRGSAYFLSQKFMLKNHDVLYVANAPASELEKFLQLLGFLSQPVLSGVVVGNTLK